MHLLQHFPSDPGYFMIRIITPDASCQIDCYHYTTDNPQTQYKLHSDRFNLSKKMKEKWLLKSITNRKVSNWPTYPRFPQTFPPSFAKAGALWRGIFRFCLGLSTDCGKPGVQRGWFFLLRRIITASSCKMYFIWTYTFFHQKYVQINDSKIA